MGKGDLRSRLIPFDVHKQFNASHHLDDSIFRIGNPYKPGTFVTGILGGG